MSHRTARSGRREAEFARTPRGRRSSLLASYTRPRVTFCPPPAPELIDIPLTPIGSIDTVKIVLKHRCSKKDLQALLDRTDFKTTVCGESREVKNGQTVRRFGCGTKLYRKIDGCRVRISAEKIEVEVSVPRVLGLLNDEQHRLSESDVLRAIRMVTVDLFPRTTLRARVPKPGLGRRLWHITRIDIAINFWGDVVEFVETGVGLF